MPLQLSSALVRRYCFVELDLAAFEPAHDLLEFRERILEIHRGDIGGNAIGGNVWVDHLLSS
jgi:hypothetical protein